MDDIQESYDTVGTMPAWVGDVEQMILNIDPPLGGLGSWERSHIWMFYGHNNSPIKVARYLHSEFLRNRILGP